MLDFIDKPINPPGPHRFTVISIFAGCGGSSLGYKWAGGKVLAAIEFDARACATYRLNHQGTHLLERDIRSVAGAELLMVAGIAPGDLDIFDGSPPCQGFSTVGKRVLADPRNDLFREYVRLLRELRPRCFVMENVAGLVQGVMKHKFVQILKELKLSGYRVQCRVLDTSYFGVPQSRKRSIFIGIREDLGIDPSHPQAQMHPIPIKAAVDVPKGTIGYITGRNERHCLAKRLPLRSPHQPMATLMATGNSRMMQPWRVEPITWREAARFGSFPDGFIWGSDAIRRIGNSVPPRFMQAIAEHIYDTVLSRLPAGSSEPAHG